MNNLTDNDLWTQIIKELALRQDPKKLVSFLSKISISKSEDNTIYISSPNQFVLVQIQKFFGVDLDNIFNNLWLKYELNIDESLKNINNPNILDINKIIQALWFNSEGSKSENINTNNNSINNSSNNKPVSNYWMTKMLSNYFGIMFDSKYIFEDFIVWSGNEFAYNICLSISKNPWTSYNPFFLWGNVWLGKTHLLQATANSIINRFPDKTVLYLPTTKFIDEVVDSIRKNKLNSFIHKFDGVDILMLDDIQFLANKEKMQEILHNLFNEFVSKNKQIIISSDRPPKQLATIEDRLRSRFWQGMICDIWLPDVETRIAIIHNYLHKKNTYLSENPETNKEIINLIANSMNDNIREIEWLLNSLIAKKQLIKKDLTIWDIYIAIQNLWYMTSDNIYNKNNLTWLEESNIITGWYNKFDNLVAEYCKNNNIDINELKSDSKKKHISQIRQELMYIAKNELWRTYARIGEYFGNKHHTAVMYAVDQYSKKLIK